MFQTNFMEVMDPESTTLALTLFIQDVEALLYKEEGLLDSDPDSKVILEEQLKELRNQLKHHEDPNTLIKGTPPSQDYSDKKCDPPSASKEKETETPGERLTCITCGDLSLPFDSVSLDCNGEQHTWCRKCTVGLFEASLKDEKLYPARCCVDPIPLRDVRHLLLPQLATTYSDTYVDFFAADRTYCFQPRCAKYIPLRRIKNGIGTCSSCNSKTCILCKHEMHEMHENGICPEVSSDTNGTAGEEEQAAKDHSLALQLESEDKLDTVELSCISCTDLVSWDETIELPCEPERHIYCRGCMVHLFESATKDESLFPPRCCRQPIPLESIQSLLTPEATLAFLDKSVEFNTNDRTYCSNPSCSTFIPQPDIEDGVAVCPECETETCALCKSESHPEEDCPQDGETKSIVDMADSEGWRRCTSCRRMIELSIGCFHMT